MSELAKQLGLLAVAVALIALILAFFGGWPAKSAPSQGAPSAPPSAAVLQQLQESPRFQYLVSYTDTGFQPQTLAIKKGQTVRFSNNSTRGLWIASVGVGADQIYPGTSSCGASALDSCQRLGRGDFWEFTFDEAGTWKLQNNLNKADGTTITVQ